MNLLKYFFSKYFLKQSFYAIIFLSTTLALVFLYLNISTNHNRYISVPDLKGISVTELDPILKKSNLNFEVTDSTFYNSSYSKFAVLEQNPKASKKVKKNRKIYLTINPSNYRKVAIPNIIQITKRSAISSLLSSDLEVGEISYVDNIGKDMVIQILYKQEEIEPGFLIPKKSKIDLVLGNGNKTEE